jgi:hypothetical protein
MLADRTLCQNASGCLKIFVGGVRQKTRPRVALHAFQPVLHEGIGGRESGRKGSGEQVDHAKATGRIAHDIRGLYFGSGVSRSPVHLSAVQAKRGRHIAAVVG